jgi:putative radical SAM enzyme (TIGR03279 family)
MDKCLTVSEVTEGSDAYLAGFLPGDVILSVNDHAASDLIEFNIYSGQDEFYVRIMRGKETQTIHVKRRPLNDFGLNFQTPVPDGVKSCNSGCIFCFVDQLPGNLRRELYIKDDDYRLSFLIGNFITLNNLTKQDIKRIVEQHISPLYVSLHTTDPETRAYMMGTTGAKYGLEKFWELDSKKIKMHVQIVLCLDINDRNVLEKTIMDIYKKANNVLSIGIVPVALSERGAIFTAQDVVTGGKHIKNRLKSFNNERALEVLEVVKKWQKIFFSRFKNRMIYASDECFLIARLIIPGCRYYEDYPQIENGIGMIRNFLDGFNHEISRFVKMPQVVKNTSVFENRRFVFLTGEYFQGTLSACCEKLNKNFRVKTRVIAVKNTCFGFSVKVAGLLCAEDLLKAARETSYDEMILIPEIVFNDDGDTLDGVSRADLVKMIGDRLHIISIYPENMIKFVLNNQDQLL